MRKGATLIELIMVMLVIAIIGATVTGVIVFFAQLFIYSPRQLNTQKIAQELSGIMIEGDASIRGFRFSRGVIDASATQFSYTYGYPTSDEELSVRLRWDATAKRIYRSTSTDGGATWSAESVIPPYMPSSVTIDGKDTSGVIFTYKKADDSDWAPGDVALIRRVVVSINLKTGSGSFSGFQGSSNFIFSSEIKGF